MVQTEKDLISVIISVYNEEEILNNLNTVITLFSNLGYLFEIIVVDDCSHDDTTLELKKINDPRVRVHFKHVNQGKGSALKTGLKLISPQSTYVVFMDADLQISPSDITTFFNSMQHNNSEVVVGNKRHVYSNTNYSMTRRLLSNCYRTLIYLLFGLPLQDTQCGFKLFKTTAIKSVMPKVCCKRFAFDLELLVSLRDNSIRVSDAPVYIRYTSKSTVRSSTIISMFIDTMAVWLRQKKGWYKIENTLPTK